MSTQNWRATAAEAVIGAKAHLMARTDDGIRLAIVQIAPALETAATSFLRERGVVVPPRISFDDLLDGYATELRLDANTLSQLHVLRFSRNRLFHRSSVPARPLAWEFVRLVSRCFELWGIDVAGTPELTNAFAAHQFLRICHENFSAGPNNLPWSLARAHAATEPTWSRAESLALHDFLSSHSHEHFALEDSLRLWRDFDKARRQEFLTLQGERIALLEEALADVGTAAHLQDVLADGLLNELLGNTEYDGLCDVINEPAKLTAYLVDTLEKAKAVLESVKAYD